MLRAIGVSDPANRERKYSNPEPDYLTCCLFFNKRNINIQNKIIDVGS